MDAHERLRRRQGPRARALDRRADVLRGRRRLPREQGPARVRPPDRRARRRPPRLHRPDEGRDGRARRTSPTGSRSRSCSSCTSSRAASRAKMSKRRGDFVTLDELIDDDRRRRDALVHDLALARVDDRPRPRAGRASRTPRTRSTTCSTRTRGSPRSCATPDAGLVEARARARRRGAVALNASERELIRRLLAFPNEVREAIERRAPHRIAGYALELGQAFAAFYRDSPVLKEPDDACRRSGSRSASRPNAPSPPRSVCSASRPRRPCRCSIRPSSITVQARLPKPYVHVDNRGLILCNGPRCVCVPASQLRTCAETFEIIADEKRATRTPGPAPRRRLRRRRRRRPLRRARPTISSRSRVELVGLRRAARGALRAMRPLLAVAARCSCCAAPARGRGAAADALLAADRLRAVRPQVDDGGAQARRRAGAGRARLRARLPGAGRWSTARTRTPSRCRWRR